MSWLRRLWQRIRPVSRSQWVFGIFVVAIALVVVFGIIYGWDYTNSPTFCGTTCHTMPPEYNAWQRSPHARVACVECHIGRDIITTTFTRKAGDLMHVVRYSSGQFTLPLYASSMIPARESCEKCHWPDKFSNDRSLAIPHYASNGTNTLVTTYLLLKTGGGTQREGRGLGIHWHIENKVDFIATDELKQNIPWIQVTDDSGKVTTYIDVENPLTPDEISKLPKHRMDCIDCHNRVSHTFRSPDKAADDALALKQIDASIPFIKQKAVEVLSAPYKSFDDASRSIGTLDGFYANNYPDYYKNNAVAVKGAVSYLKDLYQSLVFPTQDASWTTHPDNLGHKDWPGCFRCHDGKHLTADNKQAIPLECNLCHTIPEVSTTGGPAPVISLTRPDEPASHKTTTWLVEHRNVFDTSCQQCHDTNNAGGKDNSSFCSNSACHGTQWKFVGLDAPKLSTIFKAPVSPARNPNAPIPQIPHPIGGNPDCQICHGLQSKVRPYPSDHAGRTNDVCLACHKPAVPAAAPTPAPVPLGAATPSPAGGPPVIPHDTAGRTQCLGCHGSGAAGVPQIPQFHKDAGFKNENCLTCHKTGRVSQPTVAPTAVTKPTVAPTVAAPAATVPAIVAPAAKPAVAPTTAAPSASGPPNIPADHTGRTVCLVCHASGAGPKLPADHEGRTDQMCQACHKPS
jgi:nitrate/TMAO reductase-like tetraheme cytochrome c subunit